MPRDGRPARQRLQQAALDLFGEHGFDRVTAAEIAARAGVTERTFYRHFSDKREVLFDGETTLRDALVESMESAPATLAPLPALLWAFRAAVPVLGNNAAFSERRQRVIATAPALREREQAKTAVLTDALADALHRRGATRAEASLAAHIGMAAFGHACFDWFDRPEQDLDRLLCAAFGDLHTLTAPLTTPAPAQPAGPTEPISPVRPAEQAGPRRIP